MSSGRAWSEVEHEQLRSLYPNRKTLEVALVLGRTPKAVNSRAKILRIRKNYDVQGIGAKKPWTAEDERIVREQYPHRPTKELALSLRRPFWTVYQRARKLGVTKTEEYLEGPAACRLRRGDNVGAACRFLPGHVPANKGLRRRGYAPGRMALTQFKKGQTPLNTMAPWSFRWVDGYLMLKTGAPTPRPNVGWEYVHKLIWEHAHGPIPRGYRIWWKNGDHGDCSLANLELVSGAEHMARTTVQNLPAPLKKVIQLSGALKRKIRNREKRQSEKYA